MCNGCDTPILKAIQGRLEQQYHATLVSTGLDDQTVGWHFRDAFIKYTFNDVSASKREMVKTSLLIGVCRSHCLVQLHILPFINTHKDLI